MFLKKSIAKGKSYYSLAESFREGGTVKTRIIKQLGRLSPEEAEKWNLLLRSPPHDIVKYVYINDIITLNSYSHGTVAAVHAIWKRLGIDSIIYSELSHTKGRSMIAKLIETMVINRIDDPCSKLGMVEWLPNTSLPFILGIDTNKLNENWFYRSMDALWERRDRIEQELFKKVIKKYTSNGIILKDLTSSYFEGVKCKIGKKGFSRDHRPDCLQVSWSLVETEEGLPVTFEIYPGNRPDKKTVEGTMERIEKLFSLKKGVFIGDREFVTEENLKIIREKGFNYVIAETLSNIREVVDEGIRKGLTKVEGNEDLEYVEVRRGEERYIIMHGKEKEERELKTLSNKLKKGEELANKIKEQVRKHPDARKEKEIARASRELEKNHLSTYYRVEWKNGNIELEEKEKIEKEKRYAGYWVLSTDLKEKSGKEIAKMYKGLWRIEETFREIKTVFKVRPIRHRREDRVEVHIWICVLAYLIEKIAEIEVRRKGVWGELEKTVTITGERVFRTFDGVILNENSVRNDRKRRWFTVTELTDKQLELAEAVGIGKELFSAHGVVKL
jgi:transposase